MSKGIYGPGVIGQEQFEQEQRESVANNPMAMYGPGARGETDDMGRPLNGATPSASSACPICGLDTPHTHPVAPATAPASDAELVSTPTVAHVAPSQDEAMAAFAQKVDAIEALDWQQIQKAGKAFDVEVEGTRTRQSLAIALVQAGVTVAEIQGLA